MLKFAMRWLVLALLVAALVASATGFGAVAAPSSSRALVRIADNKTLQTEILVDGSGRTLYMFTQDKGGAAKLCTPSGPWGSDCPAIWPPLTSKGKPQAGRDVKASLFGFTRRPDGIRQVTYNHHPLYYFHGGHGAPAGDKKPGDVNGEGFASEWYVLSAKGTPIKP